MNFQYEQKAQTENHGPVLKTIDSGSYPALSLAHRHKNP